MKDYPIYPTGVHSRSFMGNTEEKAVSPQGDEQMGWKSERLGPTVPASGRPHPRVHSRYQSRVEKQVPSDTWIHPHLKS